MILLDRRVRIGTRVHFAQDQHNPLEKSLAVLDEVARVLLDHPEIKKVRVEGHTDNQGSEAGQLRLSQSRAEVIRQYLIDHKVEPARLEAVGHGLSQPLESNATEEWRAANNRVEFTVVQE